MKLAIILITSGREDCTEKTLDSFFRMNGTCDIAPFEVKLYHGDDMSKTERNRVLARTHGFDSILQTTSRHGAHGMRQRMLLGVVKRCDPTHIMVLENDWESVQPMPWRAIQEAFAFDTTYAFRMYGEQKQLDGTRPAGPFHAGRDLADPKWANVLYGSTECEIGSIHWGAPPCVVSTRELLYLHSGTTRDKQSMVKSGKIDKMTVRVKRNVFYHIGYERTPDFRG